LVLLLTAVGFRLLLLLLLLLLVIWRKILRLFFSGLLFCLFLVGRFRLRCAFLGLVLASGFILVGTAFLLVLLGKFGSLLEG